MMVYMSPVFIIIIINTHKQAHDWVKIKLGLQNTKHKPQSPRWIVLHAVYVCWIVVQ